MSRAPGSNLRECVLMASQEGLSSRQAAVRSGVSTLSATESAHAVQCRQKEPEAALDFAAGFQNAAVIG